MDNKFELKSEYQPMGDQPTAIDSLTKGIENGLKTQVLLGVTGSGKTFTMANIINNVNRPSLIIAHNKVLAAQLCNEFREFFPNNRVEFFVSYYDYYQPESYLPTTDTYIEKDMSINDEIDKLRHSATCSLAERRDVIVVSSVSCIYGLGAPESYYRLCVSIRAGQKLDRDALIDKLIAVNYKRNDIDFQRSTFRVRGDVVEILPSYSTDVSVRVEFFGDEVERICEVMTLTGKVINTVSHAAIFPASHYAVEGGAMGGALERINADMRDRLNELNAQNKLIEAQRLGQRVNYDMEMMREMGYCSGIENYSRYFDGRSPGQPPYTLLDYFPKDFLMFIDESHMTLPQIRAMYNGDRARKTNLIEYGFRLPAAYDNRPLKFEEFNEKIPQLVCVSATPAQYEMGLADNVAEQIIRPTGLIDPEIEIVKSEGQIDHLINEIARVKNDSGRVLVTTLTKKMAESLTAYLKEYGIAVSYMHSDIDTLERIEIVNSLRTGTIDVLVGINLLREGLDIPETQLVAILDADKEGFLRSDTALIQTIGRAARNAKSKVIMFADVITDSMKRALSETERRRAKQQEYNVENNITPKTIIKPVKNTLEISKAPKSGVRTLKDVRDEIEKLKGMMNVAAGSLDFELAIQFRTRIAELKRELDT